MKLTDTGERKQGSRGDDRTSDYKRFYKALRSSTLSAEAMKRGTNQEAVMQFYKLKGIEYGRWVNFDDRDAYLQLINIAFADLNRCLGFNNDIGFNELHFAVGARGNGSGKAHYEALNLTINITRFHRKIEGALGKSTKEERVEKTGGAGSIAHEYGHFLDHFFGAFIDQSKKTQWLSGGESTNVDPRPLEGGAMRQQMEIIMQTIVWKSDKSDYTKYYKTIKRMAKDSQSYWRRRNEIFARAFEIYIYEKMRKRKILNKGLTHDAAYYNDWPYLPRADRKPMVAEMDKLIAMMREMVVDGVDINEIKLTPSVKKNIEPKKEDIKNNINIKNLSKYIDAADKTAAEIFRTIEKKYNGSTIELFYVTKKYIVNSFYSLEDGILIKNTYSSDRNTPETNINSKTVKYKDMVAVEGIYIENINKMTEDEYWKWLNENDPSVTSEKIGEYVIDDKKKLKKETKQTEMFDKPKFKISKETPKAYLMENSSGETFWIQKRWMRKDGSLTPKGIEASKKAEKIITE
jgi:hypothetical protein